MKTSALFILLCLLSITACKPSASSPFLPSFNPALVLNKLGGPVGISYSNGSASISSSKSLSRGIQMDKRWTFNFPGTHSQLSDQLDHFRAEVERQLSASGCTIHGRGTWAGDFSGFSFEYSAGNMQGLIRVTGVSFEGGRQGIEILVYEH